MDTVWCGWIGEVASPLGRKVRCAARDATALEALEALRKAAEQVAEGLRRLRNETDLDVIRGEEG